ncbi:MAG: CvpA family protein [Candidatus Omnitrophica bacterium]|nr:CvpA family protein [Candidatus Omnitrophota bacterium]
MVYLHEFFSSLLRGTKDFLSHLNWVDLIVLIIVVRTIYIGFKKGLFIEIFKCFGLGTSIFFAVTQYQAWGGVFSEKLNWPLQGGEVLAFVSFFAACYLLSVLLRILVEKIATVQIRGAWDRVGGGVVGLGRGCLWVIFLEAIALFLTSGYLAQSIQEKSFFSPHLLTGGRASYQMVHRVTSSFAVNGLEEKLHSQRTIPPPPRRK